MRDAGARSLVWLVCDGPASTLWLWLSNFENVFFLFFSVLFHVLFFLVLWELCLFIHLLTQHVSAAGLHGASAMPSADGQKWRGALHAAQMLVGARWSHEV